MKKISIITPTYNDQDTIIETMDSVKNQTYKCWEHIIIDDGSTDETEKIVKDYIKKNKISNKVKYLKQTNQDQLNAIKNALQYITGDYIYTLHSDDLLPDNIFLQKCIDFFDKNDCDSIIGDIQIINEKGQKGNILKCYKYIKNDRIFPYVLLKNGGNIYGDVGFHKKEIYISKIKDNYLTWNTPFWIDFTKERPTQLNVKKVNFVMLNYRIHENNYIMDEIGKHNVLTGELRVVASLMKYYKIPFYHTQQWIFNLFRKRYIRNLRLSVYMPIIYLKKEESKKEKIIINTINRYYKDNYHNNKWLDALVAFYHNKNDREIRVSNLKKENIYFGSDLRKFTKDLFNDNLPSKYYEIFKEMKTGFSKIIVDDIEQKKIMGNIAKFICIEPYVEIKVKGSGE